MTFNKESDLNLATSLAIRSLFKRTQKTLEVVSEETGIDRSSLSRTNNSCRVVSFVEVCLLCDCFGISISEFQKLVEEKKSDKILFDSLRSLKKAKKLITESF